MKKAVVLGCGRRVTLESYVAAWKLCIKLPPKTWIGPGVDGWGQNAGEALADLRKGLEDRINRNLPWYGKGRKWSSDWFYPMWRASRDLNQPHLIVRWVPADLMKVPRFAERVREAREVRS